MLQFFSASSYSKFVLTSHYSVDSTARQSYDVSSVHSWINPITKMLIYDTFITGYINTPFYTWLDNARIESNLLFRDCFYFISIFWYGFQYCEVNGGIEPCVAVSGGFDLSYCGNDLTNADWWDDPEQTITHHSRQVVVGLVLVPAARLLG